MSADTTRMSETVELFVELAQSWLDRTSVEFEQLAATVDDGRFDANIAAASGARLAVMPLLAALDTFRAMSAAGAVLKTPAQRPPRESFEDEAAYIGDRRWVSVAGPFTAGSGATIPARDLSVEPARLKPGDTRFAVVVNPSGRSAGVYRGQVRLMTTGKPPRWTDVFVQVG